MPAFVKHCLRHGAASRIPSFPDQRLPPFVFTYRVSGNAGNCASELGSGIAQVKLSGALVACVWGSHAFFWSHVICACFDLRLSPSETKVAKQNSRRPQQKGCHEFRAYGRATTRSNSNGTASATSTMGFEGRKKTTTRSAKKWGTPSFF